MFGLLNPFATYVNPNFRDGRGNGEKAKNDVVILRRDQNLDGLMMPSVKDMTSTQINTIMKFDWSDYDGRVEEDVLEMFCSWDDGAS